MRAAIDSSLTPRLWEGGRRGGASRSEKPFASVEPGLCYHATAKSTHRHNIYTVTLFSACASKRERESWGVCTVRQRRRRKRSVSPNIYVLWMAGRSPKRVGLNVCENTKPLSGLAHFPTQVMWSVPPWKASLLTSLTPVFSGSDPFSLERRFAPRSSHSGRMFPLTLAEVIPVGPWRLCPSMRGGFSVLALARAAEQLPNLSS